MQVNQGGLSMGERDYYLSDEEATKKYVKDIRPMSRNCFS